MARRDQEVRQITKMWEIEDSVRQKILEINVFPTIISFVTF